MKLITLIFILPLLSCVNTKQVAITQEPTHLQVTSDQDNDVVVINNQANVNITITYYKPYCGGAAPSPEMLARRNQLMRNATYNLFNLETMVKTKVKTDTSGVLNLELGMGSYAIQEIYKDCSFEVFMNQVGHRTGKYYQEMGEDCYKKWWQSYMGEFTVISMDELQHLNMSESESCFTGNNPCIMYTGPYPP